MIAKNTNPAGNPRISDRERSATPKPAELQRFENLTRKLAQVPKREVDAKRKG